MNRGGPAFAGAGSRTPGVSKMTNACSSQYGENVNLGEPVCGTVLRAAAGWRCEVTAMRRPAADPFVAAAPSGARGEPES
jgi:hypothetical protein